MAVLQNLCVLWPPGWSDQRCLPSFTVLQRPIKWIKKCIAFELEYMCLLCKKQSVQTTKDKICTCIMCKLCAHVSCIIWHVLHTCTGNLEQKRPTAYKMEVVWIVSSIFKGVCKIKWGAVMATLRDKHMRNVGLKYPYIVALCYNYACTVDVYS